MTGKVLNVNRHFANRAKTCALKQQSHNFFTTFRATDQVARKIRRAKDIHV